MKKILLLLFLLVIPTSIFAQSGQRSGNKMRRSAAQAGVPCELSMSSMPYFHGVKLGMSYEEAASVFPEIKTDKPFQEKHAVDRGGAWDYKAQDKEEFSAITLVFKNGSIDIIGVRYHGYKWNSVTDAMTDLSNVFGLNKDNWAVQNEGAFVNCRDFGILGSSQVTGGVPKDSRVNTAALTALSFKK